MGFKNLVDADGSGTVTIDKQHLKLNGLVAEDGSIEEARRIQLEYADRLENDIRT